MAEQHLAVAAIDHVSVEAAQDKVVAATAGCVVTVGTTANDVVTGCPRDGIAALVPLLIFGLWGGAIADVPDEHWTFLDRRCVDWHETETHFFVHGGAVPHLPGSGR